MFRSIIEYQGIVKYNLQGARVTSKSRAWVSSFLNYAPGPDLASKGYGSSVKPRNNPALIQYTSEFAPGQASHSLNEWAFQNALYRWSLDSKA